MAAQLEFQFEQFDACLYTVEQALECFVPNRVWDQVRSGIHQVLYGGVGTGKTMLMKRLSWPAMLSRPAFLERREFAAFYVDMRCLADIAPLFDTSVFPPDAVMHQNRQLIAASFGTLHLLQVIAETITEAKRLGVDTDGFESALIECTNRVLINVATSVFTDALQISGFARESKAMLATAISAPAKMKQAVQDLAGSIAMPEPVFRTFANAARSRSSLRVGVLLDQYEWIPWECRPLFNAFLRRQNSDLFFALVACRPFEFSASLSTGKVRATEDFEICLVEYFNSDRPRYEALLSEIISRLHPSGGGPRKRLQGGLQYLSQYSGRSVRHFLRACKRAGYFGDAVQVSTAAQVEAVSTLSRFLRELWSEGIDKVAERQLWRVLRSFVPNAPGQAAPQIIELADENSTAAERLSEEASMIMRAAFSDGALLFERDSDVSLTTIPKRFVVSPLVYPCLKIVPSTKKVGYSTSAAINKLARDVHFPAPTKLEDVPAVLSTVFLSVFFGNTPESREARRLFREVFRTAGIGTLEGNAAGFGLSPQLIEQISECDLTLADLTALRPNIIMEIGISVGLGKRVIPIYNSDAGRATDLREYKFLMETARLPYNLSEQSIEALCNNVREQAKLPPSGAQLLKVSLNGVKLRPQQARDCVAVYYPSPRAHLWTRALERIRAICQSKHLKLIVISTSNEKGLSLFEHLVWTVSRSRSILIDTSGSQEPDSYGCFALGFSLALALAFRKNIIRTEEANLEHPNGLSMWDPGRRERWKDVDELVGIFEGRLLGGSKSE